MLRFVPIGGFLGAGKTTAMLQIGRMLEARGERVAVVTNDQGGDLVDTELSRSANLAGVGEITGGCFCCKLDDLAAVIGELESEVSPTVIIAEAVGSCTDLQATVVRPLRQLHGRRLSVAPLTVVVDPLRYTIMSQFWRPELGAEPDMTYLYRHQLDEADIIAVNKVDLLSPGELDWVRRDIRTRFPHAAISSMAARTGEGLEELLGRWASQGDRRAFDIDYQRYGAAEAELAWTNQVFVLRAVRGDFVPARWTRAFLEAFRRAVAADALIGHVKIRMSTAAGSTKASLTHAERDIDFDGELSTPAGRAEVVLNARVQVSPAELDALLDRTLRTTNDEMGTESESRRGDIFRPGFPVPTHRM